MKLKVLGSNSNGNCYLLVADNGDTLIIEAGVRVSFIKEAINFDVSKVVGCIVSHSHGDHAKNISDVMAMGIDVYAGFKTFEEKGLQRHHLAHVAEHGDTFKLAGFKVSPFSVKHDVPTFGFLIDHRECGRTAFITDTFYCEYQLPNLNNIIVEANYAKDIIDQRLSESMFLRDRVLQSHFSLDNCKDFLKANDLSAVNNIVLIHLSDRNSDEKRFKKEVEELTGKTVHVAVKGLEIDFNKTPF